MDNPHVLLLSAIVFLPALGALVLAFFPKDKIDVIRYFTLVVTALVLVACVWGFFANTNTNFDVDVGTMQGAFHIPWIPSFDIYYYMGIDGISFPLIMLTALVSLLAMAASWSITKHVKAYCILFLLLETGMLGVFLALDFFLFYVFWEVMLLPMYFLIGVWGGPRREYAAIKFFLYTLLGSVLMLIAILMLYFNSDLRKVADASDYYGDNPQASVEWENLNIPEHIEKEKLDSSGQAVIEGKLKFIRSGYDAHKPLQVRFKTADETTAHFSEDKGEITITVGLAKNNSTVNDVVAAIRDDKVPEVNKRIHAIALGDGTATVEQQDSPVEVPTAKPVHTFNLLALAAMGQHTDAFSPTLQIWAFLLLFIGFIIKVPSVPVHTWLPDAHVEAPTPISMILAGVLLKMGGYGIIRICYPICPYGGYYLVYFVCAIGAVSMVYGGFAAMAQKDFKRLVAYSSVSHMGYVVLGLGVWSAVAGTNYNGDYWNMGIKGAMFQMIAHGISSAGMFFMVGVIYDRVHHRNLNQFGGLFGKMPLYTALAIGIFFAGLGLPGLCGFWGEVFVVFSVWKFSYLLAIISASVVIITAAYILWTIQRVYLGSEYKGPHEEALKPINFREGAIAMTLFIFAILLGVFPHHIPGINFPSVLQVMDKTIDRQVDDLTDWTKRAEAKIEKEKREKNKKKQDRKPQSRQTNAPPGDAKTNPSKEVSAIPPRAANRSTDRLAHGSQQERAQP